MGRRLRTVLPVAFCISGTFKSAGATVQGQKSLFVQHLNLCSQSVLSRANLAHCLTSYCIADDAQSACMQRIFLNVGYELSEKQLRSHFSMFGVLSDLYLPKHTNGRNKGYGFATFASEKSLSLALQQSKHMITGIHVQVRCTAGRVRQETT